MFTINFADALVTMKTALNEGRLQFQNLPTNPTDREPDCEYRTNYTSEGKPIGCAWGVCFPDNLAEDLGSESIGSTPLVEIVGAPYPEAAVDLQTAHDDLVKEMWRGDIDLDEANDLMLKALDEAGATNTGS